VTNSDRTFECTRKHARSPSWWRTIRESIGSIVVIFEMMFYLIP